MTETGKKMWMFRDVDLAAVAESLGASAVRVEDPDDLAEALRAARDSNRPAVVDVVTDFMALPAVAYGSRPFYGSLPAIQRDTHSEEGEAK